MDLPPASRPMGVHHNYHFMNAAENGKQRIGRVRAFPNSIEIDARIPGDNSVIALEFYRLHSRRQAYVVRGQIGVHLSFGKNRRSRSSPRRTSVRLEVSK